MSVLVIGSVNQDITVRVPAFPAAGETLIGLDVVYGLGGKGANQAVAAARTGVTTALLATVGDDLVGRQLVSWLAERRVDVTLVGVDDARVSGTAHILVDATGENQIVVVPGANAATLPKRVDPAAIAQATLVVLQGEIPVATLERALVLARQFGTRSLLNLAPVVPVSHDVLRHVDFLVVNETEAGRLLDRTAPASLDDATEAAQALADLTGGAVVVTLGARGAVHAGPSGRVAATAVVAVDTTGAGDAFVGVMAAAIAAGASLPAAVAAGVRAATQSVQFAGAAMSYPYFALDPEAC
jgi:ribokinase